MKKILFVLGTRPEVIKMAPLIKEFRQERGKFKIRICLTGQHRQILGQLLIFFDIKPDGNLNLMRPDQSLFYLSGGLLNNLERVLDKTNPDLIFIQGDTTTAFSAALAAFYKKIKIAHIEAGLRTRNKYAPFPEEMNRVLISHLADYHFAPTKKAKQNLIDEGIKEKIWVVGNTVIDSLFLTRDIIKKDKNREKLIKNYFKKIIPDFDKTLASQIILVTGHRRESFGKPLADICAALKEIARDNPRINIIYPVHLNPNVRKPVFKMLSHINNIRLIQPLGYPELVWLMDKSYLILTDSGGIQEEAPSLRKPVLITREVSERMEGVEAKTARLVGTNKIKIVSETEKLLNNPDEYNSMKKAINPYGDGKSSKRILKIILEELK